MLLGHFNGTSERGDAVVAAFIVWRKYSKMNYGVVRTELAFERTVTQILLVRFPTYSCYCGGHGKG